VNAVSHEDVGNSLDEWSARCGECRSWRTLELAKWETRELLYWLASDRACIKEALQRSRWTDPARELGHVAHPAQALPDAGGAPPISVRHRRGS
jgi:hypothetical protein